MQKSNVWYPFTQHKTLGEVPKVKSGKGASLTLEDGRIVIDAISSWWVNIHGHAHPKIAEAIYTQAQKLEHVIFAGFTHEPAEKLSAWLLDHTPEALTKVFFSDNGSTATEVALKIAYQYFHNLGQKKHKFIAFEGAYHGDTVGAMSAGGRSIYSAPFEELLFEVYRIPFPETYIDDPDVEEKEEASLKALKEIIEKDNEIAALIVEPLVQGAGGMRMCRPEFMQKMAALLKQAGILLIFDEVMTGFGRTGELFALYRAKVTPDILCLSKGITGGFLPLAVTLCTDQLFEAFYSTDPKKTFYHGHSYTANPLGCAAAIASCELLEETKAYQPLEQKHLERIQSLPKEFTKPRVTGTIAAFTIETPFKEDFLNHGVLLRPLGHNLYILPPYCITDDELDKIYQSLGKAL